MALEAFKILATIAVQGTDDVEKKLRKTGKQGEETSNRLVSAFKKIGSAVGAYFAVDKIKDFGKACVKAAADVAAEEAAFEQIMGAYAGSAQNKLDAVANATGITNTRLTGYMTSLTAKFKGLGNSVEDATSLAARGLNIAADASAFWDMSLDDATGHLNSFINGSYEGGEAIGLFANDTQLAAYAVENAVIKNTKAWAQLDEATKQATRLEYAENMMRLSGATGQAAKESGAYLNVQGNLNEAWRQFKATVGEPILQNFVVPAMQKLTEILPKLNEKVQLVINAFRTLWNWYKQNATMVNALAAAIGVFVVGMNAMNIVNMAVGWIKKLGGAMAGLNATMLKNPILLIVSLIAALVTAFIYLWNNCEEFRAFWIGLWESIKAAFTSAWDAILGFFTVTIPNAFNSVISWIAANWQGLLLLLVNPFVGAFKLIWDNCESFRNFFTGIWNSIKSTAVSVWNSIKTTASSVWNGIKNAIMTPINATKEKVKSVIDTIKGFFNFQIKWPKIPMPHFHVSPSGWKIGDLLKGSIPRLGIDWYAKGGILTRPTLFGVDDTSGKLMAGGEAGREAVAPIDTLTGYVRDAVRVETGAISERMDTLVNMLADYLPRVLSGMERPMVLDTGALVGGIGSAMDSELGNINRMKGRGN